LTTGKWADELDWDPFGGDIRRDILFVKAMRGIGFIKEAVFGQGIFMGDLH
jgi:hypothetical protein